MKLATLKDGTRDGQLMVVARDLKTAQLADGVARTLQRALDDWSFIAPQLEAIYQDLNQGRARRAFEFEPASPHDIQKTRLARFGPTAMLERRSVLSSPLI